MRASAASVTASKAGLSLKKIERGPPSTLPRLEARSARSLAVTPAAPRTFCSVSPRSIMSHRSSPGLWPMSASAPRGRAPTAPRRAARCGDPEMPPRLTAATAVTAATTATVLPPRREVAPTVEARGSSDAVSASASAVAVATLPAIADCVSRAPGWRPPLPNMSETTARCGSLTTRSTAPPGRVTDGPRTGRPARARTSSGRNALVPSRRRVVPALGLWGARDSGVQQPLGCYGQEKPRKCSMKVSIAFQWTLLVGKN